MFSPKGIFQGYPCGRVPLFHPSNFLLSMKQTIGIRFSQYGQVLACLYDAEQDTPLAVGESAMVMTERGLNCGQVVWQRPWQEDMEKAFKAANVAVQSMNGTE